MPDITANAPDGTKHIFPDGTDPAVIDRVMKQYITGKTDLGAPTPGFPLIDSKGTPGFTPIVAGGTTAADEETQRFQRQARGTNPALTKWASEHPQEAEESRQGITRGAWENVGNLALGGLDFAKQILLPKGQTEGEKLKNIWQNVIMSPLEEQQRQAERTTGVESAGHTLASYIPILGPMAASAGESFGRRDVGGGLVTGGASLLGARGAGREASGSLKGYYGLLNPEFAKNLSESGRLLKQADAINQAQVQVVNNHVRGPLAQLEAVVNNEIGQHVKAAVDADKAHMAATGAQVGLVSAADAVKAANDKMGAMGGIAIPQNVSALLAEATRPMTMNEAKSLTTDVGRTAASLTRQGNFRQAAVLNELYDGLHKATQARADELGTGKSWQQYINLTRSYKGLQEGLAGELVDEPVHAKVMNKLIDPSRATEWNELRDELQKRGIDPTQFEKARDYAQQMSSLLQTTSNLFIGKLRAVMRHPFTAGPVAVGAAEAGHLSGIPGLGFVLPLIAAGKTAGLLDMRAVKALIKEIGASVPPEMGRAREALPSPMKPQAGAAPPPTAPAPSGPKGGINPRGYEQSLKPVDLADQITAIQQNTRDLKEQIRVASSLYSDEEIQQAEQRMSENNDLVKELQAALKNKKKSLAGAR